MSVRTMPQPVSPMYGDNRYSSHTYHEQQQSKVVDRLTQPSARQKKTIYVHPFNSTNYADFVPIAIRSDVSSLHKVLDMIQRVKGARLHSRVAGLYHFQDRSRIYSVNEIGNGEHVIYVCQGEVQAATSYASSLSSEGSTRQSRQQRMRGGQIRRENSQEGLARLRSSSPILQLQSSGSAPSASFAVYNPHSRKSISSEDVTKPSKLPSNLVKAKRILSTPQSVEVQEYEPNSSQKAIESSSIAHRSLQQIPSSSQSVASDQISLAAGISTKRDNPSKGNVQRFLEDPQNELFPSLATTSKPVKTEEDVGQQVVDRERSASFSFDIPPSKDFSASKSSKRQQPYEPSSSQGMEQIDEELQMELGGKNLTAAQILQQEPLYSEISLDIGIGQSPSVMSSQWRQEVEEDGDMNSPFQDPKMPVIHEAEEEDNSPSPNILHGLTMKYLFRQVSHRSSSQGNVKKVASAGERVHSYDDIDFKTNKTGPSFLSDPDSSLQFDPHSRSSSIPGSDSDLPQILTLQRQDVTPRQAADSATSHVRHADKQSVSDSNSISQAQSKIKIVSNKKSKRSKHAFCLCLYPPEVVEN